jgi:hypothetical protein
MLIFREPDFSFRVMAASTFHSPVSGCGSATGENIARPLQSLAPASGRAPTYKEAGLQTPPTGSARPQPVRSLARRDTSTFALHTQSPCTQTGDNSRWRRTSLSRESGAKNITTVARGSPTSISRENFAAEHFKGPSALLAQPLGRLLYGPPIAPPGSADRKIRLGIESEFLLGAHNKLNSQPDMFMFVEVLAANYNAQIDSKHPRMHDSMRFPDKEIDYSKWSMIWEKTTLTSVEPCKPLLFSYLKSPRTCIEADMR